MHFNRRRTPLRDVTVSAASDVRTKQQ